MTIPNHRDALFLRALEILKQLTAFGWNSEEREKIKISALEILPGMEYEAKRIQEGGDE